ncbi:STAS domain-containing protein [Kitasatospora sp. NPDC056138]|uniref:STAS domain-containing protein n=1 Tax=Kitasatospora sp. NPDC056138 TaxID=3345724 RepID=UPI0035D57821
MTPPTGPAPQLTVHTHAPTPGCRVLTPAGDLAQDTAPHLRTELLQAIEEPGVTTVILDCHAIAFCDLAGIHLFLRARLLAEQADVDLHLSAPPPQLLRLLEVTAADQVLKIDPAPPV